MFSLQLACIIFFCCTQFNFFKKAKILIHRRYYLNTGRKFLIQYQAYWFKNDFFFRFLTQRVWSYLICQQRIIIYNFIFNFCIINKKIRILYVHTITDADILLLRIWSSVDSSSAGDLHGKLFEFDFEMLKKGNVFRMHYNTFWNKNKRL